MLMVFNFTPAKCSWETYCFFFTFVLMLNFWQVTRSLSEMPETTENTKYKWTGWVCEPLAVFLRG